MVNGKYLKPCTLSFRFSLWLGIIFSMPANQITAQTHSVNDSSLITKKVEKKWQFDFQLDQRTSFLNAKQYSGNPITINGVTMGGTYKDKFRFGLGGYLVKAQGNKAYFIKYNTAIENLAPNAKILGTGNNKSYLVQNKTQLYYVTPSFEYIFYHSKWLDLSIPLEIGIGYSKLTLTDYFTNLDLPILNKKEQPINSANIFFPSLIGLSMMINLSPDVGLNASAGYRKIITEIGLSQDFDGFYYQIGLQLFPANIVKNLKKDFKAQKEKKKKK
jgi:hypothetical protein